MDRKIVIDTIKGHVKVFGSLLGSAIVFPSSMVFVAFSVIVSAMGRADATGFTIFGGLVGIITFMCPILTGINFVKPGNSISKISSVLILVGGIIPLIVLIFLVVDKGFNIIFTLNFIGSALITASGYLQFQDSIKK